MEPLRRGDPHRVGPYRLLGRLGAGGMGVVYLGRSRAGRPVAVKVVRRSLAGEPRYAARFRREVEAARRVSGAFTAPVLDADPDAASPWLATAYLPGLSLREAVGGFGPLPPDAVRPLAAGLAEALADIHRAGVVHRDLKPGNVMLTAGGPRVIDFGIARPEDATAITRVGAPIGTPGFMAPEQIRGERVGPAADVFSLGATLAYAATGAEPFGSGPARSRDLRAMTTRADLDAIGEPWLHGLIAACLHVDPGRRPSAAGVLERLEAPGADEPSLLGARWLPPAVAAEIGRRTAEAETLTRAPADDPADRDSAVGQMPTDDPDEAVQGTAPPAEGLTRRTILAGVGAGVMTAGGLGTFVWRRTRDRSGGSRQPGARRTGAPEGPPPEGRSLWTRRVSEDSLTLAAAGGVVLTNGIERDGDDSTGIVHALDARTGKVLWKRDGGSSAVPGGDVTYLTLNEGRQISAVRSRTGEALWTHQIDFDRLPSGELAATGPVVVFGREEITALNAAGGGRRWTSGAAGRSGLSAADGLVLALSPEALVGLDARTGKTRWTYPLDYGDYQITGDGMAFACDRFGTLHALRAGDGALAWRRRNVGGWGSQVGGGRFYVEGRDGVVLALEGATGRQIWSRSLTHRKDDPRAQATAYCLSGTTLYAICADGSLYALDTAGGRVRWTFGTEKSIRVQPVSVDGLVFIGAGDGSVRAVAAPS
ncbi:PQQ-binding-like beta-propeller repeat protein [Spirillospora sp. NPDC048819]|uniref:protein kinase domain-containing protein n=1 Tax=Spirillospora sp. NPDC048819 TaxID=3155268 RepID=UPI0034031EC3